MSPYFNTETGAMNPDSDDLHTAGPDPSAAPSPTEPKSAEPTPGERPEGYRDSAQFGREEYEHLRAAALADPLHPLNDARHPAHEATVEKYLRLGMMAEGKDYDDPEQNEVMGTLHDAKILAPEDTPEVRVPALSEVAQEQGFTWDRELHEDLVTATDDSGLPRYHVEQMFRSVAEAAEALALDADADTVEAGTAELIRTEGAGRAGQIIADARALHARLTESGVPAFVQAAESLDAVSNHPAVLRAAAALYRELCNLPPQGAWEAIILGGAAKWAEGQAAAKERQAKAAQADQTPEDTVVSHGGRP